MPTLRSLQHGALVLALATAMASAQQPAHMTWNVNGVEREALVYAQTGIAGKRPLLFVFHGHGGTMQSAATEMHLHAAWPEAVVVYPQGLPTASRIDPSGKKPGWEAEPASAGHNRDVDFFDAMLATLRQQFPIQDRQVYATGFSNGAFFTYALLAMRGETLAAIAPVAGLIRTWQPAPPRPVMVIGGSRDPLVTPDSQAISLQRLLQDYGITDPGEVCGPRCTVYARASRTMVRSITHTGGHSYPPFATETIVTFFQNHPRPL